MMASLLFLLVVRLHVPIQVCLFHKLLLADLAVQDVHVQVNLQMLHQRRLLLVGTLAELALVTLVADVALQVTLQGPAVLVRFATDVTLIRSAWNVREVDIIRIWVQRQLS